MHDLSEDGRAHGAGRPLLLTLGLTIGLLLLLGLSGCATGDARGQHGGGPDSLRVSLPGDRGSTAPASSISSASIPATPTAGATPQLAATVLRQLKRAPGVSNSTHAPSAMSRAPRAPGAVVPEVPAAGSAGGSAAGSASVFLPLGSCAAADPAAGAGAYQQIGCAAGDAVAKVIGRLPVGASVASCPAGTDFALQLSSTTGNGTAARPSGIACLRNLRAPHPGDPGGGGGVGIVPGDCLRGAGGSSVQETACDGTGPHAPDYRVNRLVANARDCPAGTTAYITVHNPGAPEQTACAARLEHG